MNGRIGKIGVKAAVGGGLKSIGDTFWRSKLSYSYHRQSRKLDDGSGNGSGLGITWLHHLVGMIACCRPSRK